MDNYHDDTEVIILSEIGNTRSFEKITYGEIVNHIKYSSLGLIPMVVLKQAGKEWAMRLDLAKPISVTLEKDNSVVIVNWNESNYNYFFDSSGNWSFEDRDAYGHSKAVSPTNKNWIPKLQAIGYSFDDSFAAVWSWKNLLEREIMKINKKGDRISG